MDGNVGAGLLDAALDGVGEGGTPSLRLDGFSGPLDHLLALARAHTIDLSRLSLGALIDQLAAALRQAPAALPLGQKADWVVMAAWLVQLRARLLLPADAPAQQQATTEVEQLRVRLVALADIQALAGWLQRRPQLGHDMFARGRPEAFGVSIEAGPAIDVIEFLWASLARFDAETAAPDTATVYRPARLALCTVAEARDRIMRRLAERPAGATLAQCLPEQPADAETRPVLRRRSAWASTLVAGLELARQGDVALAQVAAYGPIHLSLGMSHNPVT
jgi:segregation and condensation protein A